MNKIVTLLADVYHIGIYYAHLYDTPVEFVEHNLEKPFAANHSMPYKVDTCDINVIRSRHHDASMYKFYLFSILYNY